MTSSSLTPDPSTILTNLLATVKAGLIKAGISNPQVDQNSDFYVIAQALSNQLAIGFQNIELKADSQMPDTATGSDLDRVAKFNGVVRRAAGPSDGFILVTSSAATYVAKGSQLTASTGLIYQVVRGASISSGSSPSTNLVEVVSVDTGTQANLGVSSVLSWLNTPAFAASTATVYYALTGGVNAEDDETLRARLINTLQNPPMYGNWKQIAQTGESASPFIEKAYVYPTANGPGTQYVVFTGAQTLYNIQNRGITLNSQGWLDGYAAVFANAPAYVETVIPWAFDSIANANISVKNVTNDISLQLTLPYPVGSTNNGIGGGWVNFAPFPNVCIQPSGGYFAAVTSDTAITSTSFTISASAPNGAADPALVAGVSKVSWVQDKTSTGNGWVVQTATILTATMSSVSGTVGKYLITIDNPFVGVVAGDYIFPATQNGQAYLDTILASFAGLGPGQINSQQALFPTAYRQPLTSLSNPDVVDGRFLKSLIVDNTEVEDAAFYYNQSGTPSVAQSVAGNEPTVPATIPSYGGTTAVGIFVPNNIGWYV